MFKAKLFGKVGLQDRESRVIYPFILDELKAFENGIALARKGYSWSGHWGCINFQGETIIPFECDELKLLENGVVLALIGSDSIGRWGCVNLQGETLIPFEYDVLTTPENNIMRAKKDGRWGGFNSQGEVIIPFEYSEPKLFEEGVARAKKGDSWGKIDAQGNPISEDVEEVAPRVFRARQFDKWGLQNEEGRVICPFVYDEVIISRGGYIAYQGEFRSANNRLPKETFTYKALPVVEEQILEASVVNKVDYGIFISIKGMPSTLIHNNVLSKTEFGSKVSVEDKLQVIATGINKKHHVIAVELVG